MLKIKPAKPAKSPQKARKARKKPELGRAFYLSVNRLWIIDKILPKFLELVIVSLQGYRLVKIVEIDQKQSI